MEAQRETTPLKPLQPAFFQDPDVLPVKFHAGACQACPLHETTIITGATDAGLSFQGVVGAFPKMSTKKAQERNRNTSEAQEHPRTRVTAL